jgi:hypothetical protein
MVDLKKYVCTAPFVNMEMHGHAMFMCCPTWLPNNIAPDVTKPLDEIWNSEESKEVRKTLMDGSFKYCNKNQCPFLAELLNTGKLNKMAPIVLKTDFPDYIKDFYNEETGEMKKGPRVVQFAFDRTCNYKCPSCRIDMIVENSEGIKRVETTIEQIEKHFAKDLVWIYVTGSGDPFVSVGFRNFLRNFDPKKYPNLKNIHLHTNASMWNKKMWNSMKNIWPYVQTCEISIDAGTKDTYENITRLGGKWDVLIENLKFIATIPHLKYIKTSFVVQDSNYGEMPIFLETMKNIFGKKAHIFFGKINNWGTFSEGTFKLRKVWDALHPEYPMFRDTFDKVWKDPQVFHNMHEFVELNKKNLL